MYNRDELLKQLEERRVSQTEIYNSNPNDRVSYQHLVDVKKHIQGLTFAHSLSDIPKFVVYQHEDYRSSGNNHSEVNKTPIFECCNACSEALLFWMRDQNSGYMKLQGIYYSIGISKSEELNKKIIVYEGRTYNQSMLDDEITIHGIEFLD
jgi:hypothetical protein